MKFVPLPRGSHNSACKSSEVRDGIASKDARLFDTIGKITYSLGLYPTGVYALSESLIDLRDLQYFLYCTSICNDESEMLLPYVAEGLAHYMNVMHSSDAKVLEKQSPLILREGMKGEVLRRAIKHLNECVEQMCNINIKLISMALRRMCAR
jgi:hypothetical protein